MDMKKIYLFAMLFCAIQLFAGHSAVLRVKTNSGKTFEIEKIMDSSNEGASIKISKDWLAAAVVAVLEVVPDFAKAKAGEDGYYVFPDGMRGKFGFRKNGEYALSRLPMALSGMKTPSLAFAAIIKSGRFESCRSKEKTAMRAPFALFDEAITGTLSQYSRYVQSLFPSSPP